MKAILQRIANLLRDLVVKLNADCKDYEHLLQTLGIAVGLYLIYLTYISVKISGEQLNITQKQEYQKQLPIWEFEINDKVPSVKLKPFSQDVKLEQATAHFPKNLFYTKSLNWDIDQPDFAFQLTVFKGYIEEFVVVNTKYDTSYISLAVRNNFPVGIELNYVQFGELRTASAIFSIQYIWVRTKYGATITIQGVKFMRYIMSNENLSDELNKVVEENFKDMKRPKDY